ncbi:MAG: 3-phosphoshikimate 1-carboxyvinyltransferase, partial [Oscillospiraceae bacterium]|nr:3-phosphoshikimate 1-carboxyvinyltransferase [Oscillospiraceae bacterium]
MRVTVRPGLPRGEIFAPPSKSYAHRMLLCAALAGGKSVISGIARSEDMLATVDCIRALGASAEIRGAAAEITGFTDAAAKPVFPCRESGSTLRFMIPIASAVCGGG